MLRTAVLPESAALMSDSIAFPAPRMSFPPDAESCPIRALISSRLLVPSALSRISTKGWTTLAEPEIAMTSTNVPEGKLSTVLCALAMAPAMRLSADIESEQSMPRTIRRCVGG